MKELILENDVREVCQLITNAASLINAHIIDDTRKSNWYKICKLIVDICTSTEGDNIHTPLGLKAALELLDIIAEDCKYEYFKEGKSQSDGVYQTLKSASQILCKYLD